MSNFTNTSNISLVRIRDEMRMRYNPLRNLTPQRIAAAMDNFRCGYLSDASKIYDAIRRRDGVVQACVQKRKRATSRLEWTIVELCLLNLWNCGTATLLNPLLKMVEFGLAVQMMIKVRL